LTAEGQMVFACKAANDEGVLLLVRSFIASFVIFWEEWKIESVKFFD
jgi:hypothetical protein